MKHFLRQIFSDYAGQFSSKRTVVFFSFILMAVAFVANLFWDIDIEQFLYDSMLYIVIAGLGLTTVEPVANMMSSRLAGKKDVSE